tara:strand:+ start:144 stop:374 length:231 start_codon:yes stop_codon:yes gene_type:complete
MTGQTFQNNSLFFDSSAAEVFCKSLIANTSSEFMKLNLTSILSCANADISFENLSIDELSGSLTVYEIPKVMKILK